MAKELNLEDLKESIRKTRESAEKGHEAHKKSLREKYEGSGGTKVRLTRSGKVKTGGFGPFGKTVVAEVKHNEDEPEEGRGKRAGKAALKGGKAVGAGAVRAGGYAGGKIKKLWGSGDADSAIGAKWVIIALLIGVFLWYFLGWIIAAYVVVTILVLKWAHKRHKKAFKIIIIIFLIIGGVLVFAAFSGTGQVMTLQSKYFSPEDRGAMTSLAMSSLEYWWKCKIMSVRGCEIATVEGDAGGIYVTALAPSLDVFDEGLTPIQVRGGTVGKAWTSDWRGEGPNVNTIDVDVSAEWTDDTMSELYPDGWKCLPPKIRANRDFWCNHATVDISRFAGQDKKICGTSFKRAKADVDAYMYCGVRATAKYDYATLGYRLFKFTDSFDTTLFNDLEEQKVWWFSKAPVVVSIGEGLIWNNAIQPPMADPTAPEEVPFIPVTVKINNYVSTGFKAISEGLDVDAMSAKLGKFNVTMESRDGIRIMCGKNVKTPAKQIEREVICEYDFAGETITGDEEVRYVFYMYFDDYKPSAVDDYEVYGNLEYESELSRTTKLTIWYKIPEATADPDPGVGVIS